MNFLKQISDPWMSLTKSIFTGGLTCKSKNQERFESFRSHRVGHTGNRYHPQTSEFHNGLCGHCLAEYVCLKMSFYRKSCSRRENSRAITKCQHVFSQFTCADSAEMVLRDSAAMWAIAEQDFAYLVHSMFCTDKQLCTISGTIPQNNWTFDLSFGLPRSTI